MGCVIIIGKSQHRQRNVCHSLEIFLELTELVNNKQEYFME